MDGIVGLIGAGLGAAERAGAGAGAAGAEGAIDIGCDMSFLALALY